MVIGCPGLAWVVSFISLTRFIVQPLSRSYFKNHKIIIATTNE